MYSEQVLEQIARVKVNGVDVKVAERLRSGADNLTDKMDAKINSGTSRQNWTPKRQRQMDADRQVVERMERTQSAMYALAGLWEDGQQYSIFSKLKTKVAVENVLGGHYREGEKVGLADKQMFDLATTKLRELASQTSPDRSAEKVKFALNSRIKHLIRSIPGFFPTPDDVADEVVRRAAIENGMRIIEPSCGSGALLDAMARAGYTDETNDIYAIDICSELQQICQEKGYERTRYGNFLQIPKDEIKQADRFVMNPPFEKGGDIEHITTAFDLWLKPGGRLVSICSEGPFFRNDKASERFRQLVDNHGYADKLPPDSFKESLTGVSTRIVVLDK